MKKLIKPLLLISIGGSVLLFLIFIAMYFNQETHVLNEESRSRAPGKFVELSDGITHYYEEGPEDGEAILFIHGGGITGMEIWQNNYSYFVDKGYRVLLYDLYGRGYSDRVSSEYSPELLNRQVHEILEHVGFADTFSIVTNSMGGMVALDLIDNNPSVVKSLVLIDPFVTGDFNPNFLLKVPVLSDLMMTMYWYPQAIENQRKEFVDQTIFESYSKRLRYFMQFKGYKHVNYSTWMKSLNQNKQPLISKLPPEKVLIIYGKNDPYFPKSVLNSFQTLYPSIQNKEIDKAGHLPHMEKSSEVNSTIADFLIWVSLKDKQEISLDGAEPKICNGGQLTLSFHEGLKSYQWALNGVPIPLANTATYKATKTGDYTLKYQRQLDSTVYETSPLNVTSRETAKYIPILNHTGSPYLQIDLQGINNEVKLIAPSGFAEYNWYKDSEDNKIRVTKDNTIIASHGVGKSDHAGSYFVKVLQTSGCLSNSSRPIKISWQKQQPISPKPEPPKMTTVSPTEIRLDWKSYPNAVKYEVWRFRFESEDYGIQNWTFVKSLPASTTTYVDGGLVKAPYRYLIRALLPSGYAIFSKEPTQVTTPK